MYDVDTFLTILYVTIDDFGKNAPLPPRPGPAAALSPSEVITLALFSQWRQFPSERAFYRYAQRHLGVAFPTLPDRAQFNRLVRTHHDAIVAVALALGWQVSLPSVGYEVLDSMGVPVRNAKRRGRGHLAGQAALGWCNRVGWFMGLKLLTVVTRVGAITGFGLGPGNSGDHLLAETLLAARQQPAPRLRSSGALGGWLLHRRYRLCGPAYPAPLGENLWSGGDHPARAAATASLAKTVASVAGSLARDRRDRA